jgi:hypothetical protein
MEPMHLCPPASMGRARTCALRRLILQTRGGKPVSKDYEHWVEEHMQRFRKPDGYCLHCRRPANQHHPVGPITITIRDPDGEETHEFCNWECLAHWFARQAGGVFIVDRN